MTNIVEGSANLPNDRRRRSEVLCAAADFAVVQGDLDLAQRLLIQADVDDPRNPYPQERISWVDREIGRLEVLKSSAKRIGRKFDFLYAPTLRGLSTELSSLLPLHPDVFSVSKHELDDAIKGETEQSLLRKYQQQVLNDRQNIRAGLVQHSFIAGQLAGAEVATRLAELTTRKLFIHGVRDPVRLTISTFNHELITRYGGAYRFSPICAGSPFNRSLYTLKTQSKPKRVEILRMRRDYWRKRAGRYRRVLATQIDRGRLSEWLRFQRPSKFSIDQSLVREQLDHAMSQPRHFAVGCTYAQQFDVWTPVDLERPKSAHDSVISRIFRAINVDSQFDHPAFHASEGTMTHRLMVQNWIEVNAFGHTLYLGINYANRAMFSNTFLYCEMLPFEPDERFSALGLGNHTLCVSVQRGQWRLLPRDVRIRLVESEELLRFRNRVLIPAWLKNYEQWIAIMRRYILRELPRAELAQLRERIGSDLESFLKHHPQFEQAWPSTRKLVGS